MAERDGTIVIDTQIDTKGVDAGSEKTEVQADCHVLAEWSERQSVALLHSEKMRQNP